jgi:hypothetical protein
MAANIAVIAGIAAAQTAVILSQQAPQLRKGGTGILGGKSHEQGGTPFMGMEAERDERWAVFSRDATRRNPGLESLINSINSGQLIVDGKGGRGNIIVNVGGSEDMKRMRELMEKEKQEQYFDGKFLVIKKGSTTIRMYN